MNTATPMMERLAELEHEQWMHWSQSVATLVDPATRHRWAQSWKPYRDLPEEQKELDRVWARKVVAAFPEQSP